MRDFVKLSLDKRAELVWKKGKSVDSLKSPLFAFVLFQLDNFFVEFVIDDDRKVIEIVPFRGGPRLEKYLNRISIASVLEP